MKRQSVAVIFNPVAGQHSPEQTLAQLQAYLQSTCDLNILQTSQTLGARQLTHQALQHSIDLVIAAGGDGTVSQVAQELVHSQIPLGIIPLGTANVFAMGLGIPATVESACEVITQHHIRDLDVGICNGQIFIVKTSIGYGADTIQNTSRASKNRWGLLAYILQGIRQLKTLRSYTAKIETEQETIHAVATSVTVANSSSISSILAQGPEAVIADDGLLDMTVLIVDHWLPALLAFADLFTSALRQTAAQVGSVHRRVKQLTIETNPPRPIVIDGDPAGTTPVTIECIPQCLQVIVPRSEP